jgi:hypothetical protein
VRTTVQATPDWLPGASFDRAYWLSHCEGFRVDTVNGHLGFVEEIRSGDNPDGAVLAVRAGLLGRRIVLVPARDVEFIVPRAQRLWLHSPARIIGTEPAVGDQ